MENLKLIAGVLFGLFILWFTFGGLLEDPSNRAKPTVIDCSRNPSLCAHLEEKSYEQQQDNAKPDFLDAQGI